MPKEMTFTEAVRTAMMVCTKSQETIIELSLHPDGLWTVRWILDDPTTIYEQALNSRVK